MAGHSLESFLLCFLWSTALSHSHGAFFLSPLKCLAVWADSVNWVYCISICFWAAISGLLCWIQPFSCHLLKSQVCISHCLQLQCFYQLLNNLHTADIFTCSCPQLQAVAMFCFTLWHSTNSVTAAKWCHAACIVSVWSWDSLTPPEHYPYMYVYMYMCIY